ncbi:hypothetical protein AnigIFM62618_000895 [Aspergillus niger]|nr:hypothetical protein AnigIFM62618_000895 [Aspergillus niger]
MGAHSPIIVRLQGHIAVVIINRPDKLNSMNQDHYNQLGESHRRLDRTADITITVLTGKGRFFSAGSDVSSTFRNRPHDTDIRRVMSSTYFSNLDLTHTLSNFSKILVVALNGPVVGFPAALIAQADFIYAAPHTFLHTPFSSLGVPAEGAASRSFVRRLGVSKANDSLVMSRRISCEDLVASGFVNEMISAPTGKPEDSVGFLERIPDEVQERFIPITTQSSLLSIKNLIREPESRVDSRQNYDEVFAGLEMVTTGVAEQQMQEIKEGRKRHKL